MISSSSSTSNHNTDSNINHHDITSSHHSSNNNNHNRTKQKSMHQTTTTPSSLDFLLQLQKRKRDLCGSGALTKSSSSSALDQQEEDNLVYKLSCETMKRTQEMLHCQEKVHHYQSRLKKLRQEHKSFQTYSRLASDAAKVWPTLSKKDRFRKDYLLTALKYSPELPLELTEAYFAEHVPLRLREDPEIFIARLLREDFRTVSYPYDSILGSWSDAFDSSTTTAGGKLGELLEKDHCCYGEHAFLQIPTDCWSNKQVMLQVVERYPEVFSLNCYKAARESPELGGWMYHDVDILRTTISWWCGDVNNNNNNSPRFETQLASNHQQLWQWLLKPSITPDVLACFSLELRKTHPELLLKCVTCVPGPATQYLQDTGLLESKDFALKVASELLSMKNTQQTECSKDPELLSPLPSPTTSSTISLRDFSYVLWNDIDVVLAFCSYDGCQLEFASPSLQTHIRVIKTACQETPGAFLYCRYENNTRVKRSLLYNRKFLLESLLQHPDLKTDAQTATKLWDLILSTNNATTTKPGLDIPPLKDLELCIAAAKVVSRDSAKAMFLQWNENRSFLNAVLPHQPWLWDQLPKQQKRHVDLALQAVQCLNESHIQSGLINRIIKVRPDFQDVLFRDDQLLCSVVRYGTVKMVVQIIQQALPLPKELCLKLCKINDLVYELLRPYPYLFNDYDILRAAARLEDDDLALQQREDEEGEQKNETSGGRRRGDEEDGYKKLIRTQQQTRRCASARMLGMALSQSGFPDLVALAIRQAVTLKEWEMEEIHHYTHPDMWLNKEVALEWIRLGGGYLYGEFPENFEDDPDIFLAVAEFSPGEFYFASQELYGEKEFMRRVLEKNGSLLDEVDYELVDDFDLMLTAFAQCPELVAKFEAEESDSLVRLSRFASKVRERLECHLGFLTVLNAITLEGTTKKPKSRPCHLRLLDQGNETCMGLKRMIADFSGIPRGKELHLLRCVSANLAQWGY